MGKSAEKAEQDKVGTGIAVVCSPVSAWCGVGINERDQEMGNVRIGARKCATREYWKGQREINRVNRRDVSPENGMQGVRTETVQGEWQFQLPEIQEMGASAVGA